jgi:hypothetical protein
MQPHSVQRIPIVYTSIYGPKVTRQYVYLPFRACWAYDKPIAANSHRLFVTFETPGSASPSAGMRGNLSGVISIGDSKRLSSHSPGD